MPELVKMYIRHVAIGFGIAAVFVAALLWFNVVNLAELVMTSNGGYLALFLLWFFNGLVFAGVQFGIAVMNMAEKPEKPGGGAAPRMPMADAFGPVPVKIDAARDLPARKG
jgi:hypothetical protein